MISGGKLYISGAYIGSDLFKTGDAGSKEFAKNVLKISLNRPYAVKSGGFFSSDSGFLPYADEYFFNTEFHPEMYKVEAPDAIFPTDSSRVLLRFSENHFANTVGYLGDYRTIVSTIPFESILSKDDRHTFMQAVFKYFEKEVAPQEIPKQESDVDKVPDDPAETIKNY